MSCEAQLLLQERKYAICISESAGRLMLKRVTYQPPQWMLGREGSCLNISKAPGNPVDAPAVDVNCLTHRTRSVTAIRCKCETFLDVGRYEFILHVSGSNRPQKNVVSYSFPVRRFLSGLRRTEFVPLRKKTTFLQASISLPCWHTLRRPIHAGQTLRSTAARLRWTRRARRDEMIGVAADELEVDSTGGCPEISRLQKMQNRRDTRVHEQLPPAPLAWPPGTRQNVGAGGP
jgi:hypothetical protein